ncbi:MAG TPA: hypothetical protein DDZ80_24095 [Cyanobacteria bacterium UBA8803]|nr:hypothetical protein [Cyanobacteria bacterium UBA9273]HBL61394.1 hypothetical protein [Cyanobacteria bacterium UBA8803]
MDLDEIARLGASLRQIDQRLLPAKQGITKVWYQGGEPYFDVIVELRQGKIEWFQFTFRGKSISWQPNFSDLQTGQTNELHTDDLTFHPASKLIENNQQKDVEFIKLACAILQTHTGEPFFDQILLLFEEKRAEGT